jgi:hypothetical protein
MENLERLERKLTMGVLKKDKNEIINAIAEGAVPTSSLFHHAFDDRAYDIALTLSQYIIFTKQNKVVIGLVKNMTTNFERSAVCFEILDNMVMNNNDLLDLVQEDLFPSRGARIFKEKCKIIKLNSELSNLASKPETKSKIKI